MNGPGCGGLFCKVGNCGNVTVIGQPREEKERERDGQSQAEVLVTLYPISSLVGRLLLLVPFFLSMLRGRRAFFRVKMVLFTWNSLCFCFSLPFRFVFWFKVSTRVLVFAGREESEAKSLYLSRSCGVFHTDRIKEDALCGLNSYFFPLLSKFCKVMFLLFRVASNS